MHRVGADSSGRMLKRKGQSGGPTSKVVCATRTSLSTSVCTSISCRRCSSPRARRSVHDHRVRRLSGGRPYAGSGRTVARVFGTWSRATLGTPPQEWTRMGGHCCGLPSHFEGSAGCQQRLVDLKEQAPELHTVAVSRRSAHRVLRQESCANVPGGSCSHPAREDCLGAATASRRRPSAVDDAFLPARGQAPVEEEPHGGVVAPWPACVPAHNRRPSGPGARSRLPSVESMGQDRMCGTAQEERLRFEAATAGAPASVEPAILGHRARPTWRSPSKPAAPSSSDGCLP